MEAAARCRIGGRLPTLVARHGGGGVPLARAGGAVGRRSREEEELLAAVLGGRSRGFQVEIGSGKAEQRRVGDLEPLYPRWRFLPGVLAPHL